MKAYRFVTKISERGTIQIPYNLALFEEEVEVVILPKIRPQEEKIKAAEFVEKWRGLLAENDTEKSKYEYLADKYK